MTHIRHRLLRCRPIFCLALTGMALTLTGRPVSAQNGSAQSALPAGVDRVMALEGDNSLLVSATPEGFADLRDLVRCLDGQLDIVRTVVARVDLTSDQQAKLGLSLNDTAGMIAAYHSGRLKASEALAITTRETTVVDALLSDTRADRAGTPVSLVPRVSHDGSLSVELFQPLSAQVSGKSGETSVLILSQPTEGQGPVSLLFVTPTLRPSTFRRNHG